MSVRELGTAFIGREWRRTGVVASRGAFKRVADNPLAREVQRRRKAVGLDAADGEPIEADSDGETEANLLLREVNRRRRTASGGANPLLALVERRRAAAGLPA